LAFEKIVEKEGSAKLVLAGDGPERKRILELVQEKKIKNIKFLGNVKYENLVNYVNESDICVALFDRNYSTIKKFGYFYSPIKVHEYKACGKPVVASGIGNLKELVRNGVNGFTVDERNVDEIVDAVLKLFGNDKLRERIRKNNIKEREKYNWKSVTKNIIDSIK